MEVVVVVEVVELGMTNARRTKPDNDQVALAELLHVVVPCCWLATIQRMIVLSHKWEFLLAFQ